MDLAELNAFMAVAETGSFSQAAEHLHLTQPAVSKRISQLESSLDCQLFDRIGRQVSLTEAGRDLLPRASRILLEVEDLRRAMSNLGGGVSGILKIGTSHHIGLHRLPPVLKQFSTLYPEVKLDIQFIDSEMAFDLVMHGKLELGIVTLPPDEAGPLCTLPVWEDPLAFMIGVDHPLAAESPVALQALAAHPAILPSMSTFTRRIVEELFQQRQLKIEVPISTNYLETIKMMASIGLGWTVLPATMLDHEVTALPIRDVCLSRSLGVVYHPRHSLSNAAKAILQLLEALPDSTR
ncbi:LysR family transcriptional regulator [Ketobacter sp.]|uniref:LysR family transcriptional regulator n=1 Tax=Ketobacter sp. TaxID=2083498 RepID=UPI000F2CDF04|nr:LysR family transcriptional regulator [Ketobacter sp.]RLT98622.1 MAG: LysR family transcriptional regulator [Ketobacter sp.]